MVNRKIVSLLMLVVSSFMACSQDDEGAASPSFEVFLTGNASDVNTETSFGLALLGGADAFSLAETKAFQFLVDKSGGGDFVVLRASGGDGYNDFIFHDIGGVNSVRTIIVDAKTIAEDPDLIDLVENAEAIFIAGGDQNKYVRYWKDTGLANALNALINEKKIPIGGSSAGLAILGEYYYGASAGSVITSEGLSNPYHENMNGLDTDFLEVPYLSAVITDSHYADRERQGRHFAFMARVITDFNIADNTMRGVGVDEATAVLVEPDGNASIIGDGDDGAEPETCVSNSPLTWNINAQAVSAYVVPGTDNGSNTFNFNTWSGSGGAQEYWSANNGNFVRQ